MHVPPSTTADAAAPLRHGIVRNTALVAVAALGSRVLGFVRDMSMAWLLGSSLAADALVLALRLPHVLRRLFGEGALSMTLTTDFVHQGHEGLSLTPPLGLAKAVGLRLALVLGTAVLLGEVLARPLVCALAPGLAHNAALTDEAVPLLRLCLPYAFTAGMAALGMALLHSVQRFLLPALMPALFNVVVLLFALAAALHWAPAAWLLACGVLCGGVAQWLAQAVALRRALPSRQQAPEAYAPPPPGQARHCLTRLPLGVLGAAAPQLAMLGGMVVASWLPQGSLAALYYAERLLELPMGVAGAALGVASLPTLARLAAEEQHEEFAHVTNHALRLSLCVTLPAAAGLVAVALPLVQTLFARGAFDAEAVRATVLAVAGYAPGLPAYGLTRPLLAACHARRLARATAVSGLAAVLVAVAGSALFATLLPAPLALLGPPLGVSLGLWAQCLLLFGLLNKKNSESAPPFPFPTTLNRRSLAQQCFAALLTGLGAWSVTLLPLPPWACLPLGVGIGALLYVVCLRLLRNAEYRELLEIRRHKRTNAHV